MFFNSKTALKAGIVCFGVLLSATVVYAKICWLPNLENCDTQVVTPTKESLCKAGDSGLYQTYDDCMAIVGADSDSKKCIFDNETDCYVIKCRYTESTCQTTANNEYLAAGGTENYTANCITQGKSGCGGKKSNPCCPYISRKCTTGESEAGCNGYELTKAQRDQQCTSRGYVCSSCTKTVYNVTCKGTTPTTVTSNKIAYKCNYIAPEETFKGCDSFPLTEDVKAERIKNKYTCSSCTQTGYDKYKTCDGTSKESANKKTRNMYSCTKQCVDYTGCDDNTLIETEAEKAKTLGYTCGAACSETITKYSYNSYETQIPGTVSTRAKYKCEKDTYGDCATGEIGCEKCEKYPLLPSEKDAWLTTLASKEKTLLPDSSYVKQGNECTSCDQTVKHWNYKKVLNGKDCKNGICDTTCDSVTPAGVVEKTSTRPMWQCQLNVLKKTNCLTGYPLTDAKAKQLEALNAGWTCSRCTQTLDYYHYDSNWQKVSDSTQSQVLANCVRYETSQCPNHPLTETQMKTKRDSEGYTCNDSCSEVTTKYTFDNNGNQINSVTNTTPKYSCNKTVSKIGQCLKPATNELCESKFSAYEVDKTKFINEGYSCDQCIQKTCKFTTVAATNTDGYDLSPQETGSVNQYYCTKGCETEYTGCDDHPLSDEQKAVKASTYTCMQCEQSGKTCEYRNGIKTTTGNVTRNRWKCTITYEPDSECTSAGYVQMTAARKNTLTGAGYTCIACPNKAKKYYWDGSQDVYMYDVDPTNTYYKCEKVETTTCSSPYVISESYYNSKYKNDSSYTCADPCVITETTSTGSQNGESSAVTKTTNMYKCYHATQTQEESCGSVGNSYNCSGLSPAEKATAENTESDIICEVTATRSGLTSYYVDDAGNNIGSSFYSGDSFSCYACYKYYDWLCKEGEEKDQDCHEEEGCGCTYNSNLSVNIAPTGYPFTSLSGVTCDSDKTRSVKIEEEAVCFNPDKEFSGAGNLEYYYNCDYTETATCDSNFVVSSGNRASWVNNGFTCKDCTAGTSTYTYDDSKNVYLKSTGGTTKSYCIKTVTNTCKGYDLSSTEAEDYSSNGYTCDMCTKYSERYTAKQDSAYSTSAYSTGTVSEPTQAFKCYCPSGNYEVNGVCKTSAEYCQSLGYTYTTKSDTNCYDYSTCPYNSAYFSRSTKSDMGNYKLDNGTCRLKKSCSDINASYNSSSSSSSYSCSTGYYPLAHGQDEYGNYCYSCHLYSCSQLYSGSSESSTCSLSDYYSYIYAYLPSGTPCYKCSKCLLSVSSSYDTYSPDCSSTWSNYTLDSALDSSQYSCSSCTKYTHKDYSYNNSQCGLNYSNTISSVTKYNCSLKSCSSMGGQTSSCTLKIGYLLTQTTKDSSDGTCYFCSYGDCPTYTYTYTYSGGCSSASDFSTYTLASAKDSSLYDCSSCTRTIDSVTASSSATAPTCPPPLPQGTELTRYKCSLKSCSDMGYTTEAEADIDSTTQILIDAGVSGSDGKCYTIRLKTCEEFDPNYMNEDDISCPTGYSQLYTSDDFYDGRCFRCVKNNCNKYGLYVGYGIEEDGDTCPGTKKPEYVGEYDGTPCYRCQ